jgi:hypothetical protein
MPKKVGGYGKKAEKIPKKVGGYGKKAGEVNF